MVLTRSARARVAASDVAETPDAVAASHSTRASAESDDADVASVSDRLQAKLELTDLDTGATDPLPSSPSASSSSSSDARKVEESLLGSSAKTASDPLPPSPTSSSSSKDAKEVEALLISNIREILAEPDAEELDVIENMKVLLDDAATAVRSVKQFKKDPEKRGWTVSAVSLSRLTQAHLSKLGVVFQQPVTLDRFKDVIAKLEQRRECSDIRRQFDRWDSAQLDQMLKLWASHLGAQNEAANRIILNQTILAAIQLCLQNKTFLIVIPEPVLAKKGGHAIIEHQASMTSMLLTGLADYCLLTLKGGKVADKTFLRVVEEMRGQKTLISKLSGTENDELTRSFMLIELKDNSKDLRAQLPQAVGEAIVLDWKMGQHQQLVPFCLTNITGWIYGVLDRRDGGYQCWTTATLVATEGFTTKDQVKGLVLWATVFNPAMREAVMSIIELD